MSIEIDFKGSRVAGNINQNEPLRLGPMSFGLRLMDRGHLEFYISPYIKYEFRHACSQDWGNIQ